MMRWCLTIIVVLPLLGDAQKFSGGDIATLNAYCTGVFSNESQAKADSHFIQTGLKVQRIWPKRKDGIWLFAEKTDTSHHFQVWHLYLQDDTTVLMQLLDFKSNQKALQLSQDSKQQSDLYLNSLLMRHGCELYFKKNKIGYTGTSAGKDCLADKAGVEYITYNITVTKNTLVWNEIDFGKEDKQLSDETVHLSKQVKSLK
jgi:CpeT/CpcT family (DUF1001)